MTDGTSTAAAVAVAASTAASCCPDVGRQPGPAGANLAIGAPAAGTVPACEGVFVESLTARARASRSNSSIFSRETSALVAPLDTAAAGDEDAADKDAAEDAAEDAAAGSNATSIATPNATPQIPPTPVSSQSRQLLPMHAVPTPPPPVPALYPILYIHALGLVRRRLATRLMCSLASCSVNKLRWTTYMHDVHIHTKPIVSTSMRRPTRCIPNPANPASQFSRT